MVLQTAIQSREGEAPAEPPSRCVYLLRRLSRASGLSRLKSGVPLYAVKDVSLRTRCAGRECATACPLRARSALRCGLLKIVVWDTLRHCVGEDSDAVARRPDRLPKTLNGVECHWR